MNAHEESMIAAMWARFQDWLPRMLSDGDRAAITDLLVATGERGREPTCREMLEAVRDNPGADLRNVEAYFLEWRGG